MELPLASFPIWFWDYDNDGALDLFVTTYGGRNIPSDVAWVAADYLGIQGPVDVIVPDHELPDEGLPLHQPFTVEDPVVGEQGRTQA